MNGYSVRKMEAIITVIVKMLDIFLAAAPIAISPSRHKEPHFPDQELPRVEVAFQTSSNLHVGLNIPLQPSKGLFHLNKWQE